MLLDFIKEPRSKQKRIIQYLRYDNADENSCLENLLIKKNIRIILTFPPV
jgi:hypothetical protein